LLWSIQPRAVIACTGSAMMGLARIFAAEPRTFAAPLRGVGA